MQEQPLLFILTAAATQAPMLSGIGSMSFDSTVIAGMSGSAVGGDKLVSAADKILAAGIVSSDSAGEV